MKRAGVARNIEEIFSVEFWLPHCSKAQLLRFLAFILGMLLFNMLLILMIHQMSTRSVSHSFRKEELNHYSSQPG